EREQAGVAIEKIEAQGEEPVDQHLRRQRLVRDEKRKDREEDDEGGDRMGRDPPGDVLDRRPDHSARPASPKSPLGRTSSTIAITMKMTSSASLGAKKVVRLTISPMTTPATMAPARLPLTPPITTTKESMITCPPTSA